MLPRVPLESIYIDQSNNFLLVTTFSALSILGVSRSINHGPSAQGVGILFEKKYLCAGNNSKQHKTVYLWGLNDTDYSS